MKTTRETLDMGRETRITTTLSFHELIESDDFLRTIVREAARHVADFVIEQHGKEILERISPEAIANMAIAEAGAAINETLQKKLPDKIIEVEKRSTEVYQRGLFGGMKRIR